MRDPNFFQVAESKFRILGGLHFFGHGGGKPEGKEGGILTHPRDEKYIRSVPEYDEQPDRARLNTTIPLHPQEGA